MNSEELEQSLRTEFEEQLKNVFAEMRQELAQLQEKVEAEFEKHKSQLSEVFQDFSARIESEKELDASFSDSVVEHLRLARDEGARITATAIAEAEEMQRAQAAEAAEAEAAAMPPQAAEPPSVDMSEMRDAITDISSQTSQSSILKSLVQHAEKFTTRGAFFILKNEHFVGWRVFGSSQEATDEQTVREIFFPVSSETVLGESVRSLSAVESSYGTYSGDSTYLDKLGFGQPEKMFAIPLVARGRGVAVLYADSGEQNEQVNVEALETLVRVAGLTVEVIASTPAGSSPTRDTSVQPQPSQNYSNSGASSVPTQEKETNASQTENLYQPEEVEETTETSAAKSYQPEEAHNFADSQATDFSAFHQTENAEIMPGEATSYQSPNNDFSFQSSQQFDPESLTADDFEVEVIQDEDEAETQEFHFASQGNEESQTDYGQTETPVENYPWTSTYTENLSDSTGNNAPDDDLIESSYQPTYESAATEDFSAPTTTAAANEYPSFENTQYESEQQQSSPQMQFEETPAFDSSQYEEQSPSNNAASPSEDFSFSNNNSYDSFRAENDNSSDFAAAPAAAVAPAPTADETTSQQPAVATPPIKSRFSDRNVDLPIEVSEDERRLHNDARRFARLLVSEIKLYNEQKVKEGRESHDLYERLREAIDRSREMYDKRVQPPVAAKFDYFHYELVNTLAEGEPTKLGGSYQGAAV